MRREQRMRVSRRRRDSPAGGMSSPKISLILCSGKTMRSKGVLTKVKRERERGSRAYFNPCLHRWMWKGTEARKSCRVRRLYGLTVKRGNYHRSVFKGYEKDCSRVGRVALARTRGRRASWARPAPWSTKLLARRRFKGKKGKETLTKSTGD